MPAVADRVRSALRRLHRSAGPASRSTGTPAGATLAAAVVALATAACAQAYDFAGLALHRLALRAWLSGDSLYAYPSASDHLGFTLPPAAALLLAPTAALPLTVAGWCAAVAGSAALVLALIALIGPARRYSHRRWLLVAAAALLALPIEPVRAAIGLGHLDLVLFGLVTADMVALRRRAWALSRPVSRPDVRRVALLSRLHRLRVTGGWAGAGTGLATAVGGEALIFSAYLLVTRQWRAAGTACGTTAAVVLVTAGVTPAESRVWFSDVLWRTDLTGPADESANQSLAGVFARLYDSTTTPVLQWLPFALLLLAVGVIRAAAAHTDGDEAAAFTIVGLTGAVIGPVTETHEMIWVATAVLILVDAAARKRTFHRARGLRVSGGQPGFRREPSRRGPGLPGFRWEPGQRTRHGRRPPAYVATRRRWPTVPGLGCASAAVVVYLIFVSAPVWAFSQRLPEASHQAAGLLGVLGENSFALVTVLLVTALPWRAGAAPALPGPRWRPVAHRGIAPARRPVRSEL